MTKFTGIQLSTMFPMALKTSSPHVAPESGIEGEIWRGQVGQTRWIRGYSTGAASLFKLARQARPQTGQAQSVNWGKRRAFPRAFDGHDKSRTPVPVWCNMWARHRNVQAAIVAAPEFLGRREVRHRD